MSVEYADKDFEYGAVSQSHEMFTESADVIDIFQNLPSIYADTSAVEKSLEKIKIILNKYQEQPHLLDPYLEEMLETAITLIRNPQYPAKLKDVVFKHLRWIINTRGYKTFIRYLPHEVSDVEPVLTMLDNVNVECKEDWETGYVLVLWLSIIVKIPFAMSRMDGVASSDKTVMRRVLDVCKTHLRTTMCSAAAYLSACFLTRSDVFEACLAEFLSWTYDAMVCTAESTAEDERNCISSLTVLAALLKHGKREDILPYAMDMLQKVMASNYKSSKNSLLRKCGVKVVQRIGLMFLKPKLASWRYQRGMRSLAENLKADAKAVGEEARLDDSEEDIEVPQVIEDILEELMQGLRDPETVIRWSAAKGVGRVSGRLPMELAGEVASGVLDLLTPRETDAAWHGGCLALAELGRRGLLLPQALPKVVPLLLQALMYEETRGYYSIGDHVRDAACYVAWSFARAYDPLVLKPFVPQLATGLLQVALFDREVKCRKAAAAAFQEHVGRQGAFPHGIDIVTTADYFSLAVRQNAYLNISVFVAKFPEYTVPLITHVATKKVVHWDAAVRELATQTLYRLVPLAPARFATVVLPDLLVLSKSSDVNARHGGLLATGEVILSLSLEGHPISKDVQDELLSLATYYRERFYFNGMGGEILRQGFCHLIKKVSEARLSLDGPLDDWLDIIEECLIHEVPSIRQRASAALGPFLMAYRSELAPAERDLLLNRYLNELNSTSQTSRMGFAAAISSMPSFILIPRLVDVVNGLLESLHITEQTVKWAEYRRDCICALVSVSNCAGISAMCDVRFDVDASVATSVGSKTRLLPVPQEGPALIHALLEAFLISLSEYTQDARGDIGAWVREAAMTAFEKLIPAAALERKQLLVPELLGLVVGGVAQQAVERIDRTRALAARVFISLIHHTNPVLDIPHRGELLQLFPLEESAQWGGETVSFPRFVPLLRFPCYCRPVLEGLVLSIGGLTERLVKVSSAAFMTYLKTEANSEDRKRIGQVIIDIFEAYQYDSRMMIPLLAFLDRLLGSGVISDLLIEDGEFPTALLKHAKLEVARAKDFRKVSGSMDLFCQLVQVKGSISRRSLTQMSVYLCFRLKAVRKVAATKLYETLLLYGDVCWIPPENLDDVMTLLSDTNWELDVAEVRPLRNQLCALMNVPVPTLLTKEIT